MMTSTVVHDPSSQLQSSKNTKDDKDAKGPAKNHGILSSTSVLDSAFKRLKVKKLDRFGESLFDSISDYYRDHTDKEGQEDSCIHQIRNFLKEGGNGAMDACIRWRILVAALDSENDKTADVVCDVIISINPELAFACRGFDYNTALTDHCFNGCKDVEHKKAVKKCIPFNLAAKMGKHKLIGSMISKIKGILDDAKNQPTHALNKTTILELVQLTDKDTRESPLVLAQMAEHTPLETLEELLKVDGIADGSKAFEQALENGWDRIVKAFLGRGFEVSTANGDPILKALDNLETEVNLAGAGKSVRSSDFSAECRLNIVQYLVEGATAGKSLSENVVERLMQKNLTQVWNIWKNQNRNDDGSVKEIYPWLLHMAVREEKVDFVEIFVDDYPQQLSKEEAIPGESKYGGSAEKYPLWYKNWKWQTENEETGCFILKHSPSGPNQKVLDRIREMVVTKMIHELDMDKLPDILHRSYEPFNDVCFDISQFNSAEYRISDIVDSLILQDNERPMHQYEKTLKYVAFPPLDTMVPDREVYRENLNLKMDHDEVFRVLDWLRGKEVKKIIKLTVPDRLVNPHDDLKMAAYVKEFKVEVLDWKVLDLSIAIFRPQKTAEPAKEEIQELSLYSSGKRAAINHWFNKDEGVESLSKLRKLHINIVRVESFSILKPDFMDGANEAMLQETCTANQFRELHHYIQVQNQELIARTQTSGRRLSSIYPVEVAWYPSPDVADLSKIAMRVSPPLATWLTSLAGFIERRNNDQKGDQKGSKHKPTRVAILDNGVLSISPVSKQAGTRTLTKTNGEQEGSEATSSAMLGSKPPEVMISEGKRQGNEEYTLSSRIKAGRSFVDGNLNFSPWQFPSDPHGTQMANLICAVDPFCEIYVARVAEDAFGIKAKNVEKAIQWAMDEEVDIISMSFVLGEDPDNVMEKKIKEAGAAGIVMTCSTHDEGSRIRDAYPALSKSQCKALLVLAACDEYGKLLRDINENLYSYMLRGQDVPAGVIPFIKSKEKISGSSVATALGAGICSLILTCARLAVPGMKFDKFVNLNDRHLSKSSRLYVILEHLGVMLSDDIESKYVLLERFGGIAQPSVGVGVKHESRDKSGNAVPPTPREVLCHYFGMK